MPEIVGITVIWICIAVFVLTAISFFLGLWNLLQLGGTQEIHKTSMSLLMKVLAVEIIASCTLFFGSYVASISFEDPPVSKGVITYDDASLTIDLNRTVPATLNRMTYVINQQVNEHKRAEEQFNKRLARLSAQAQLCRESRRDQIGDEGCFSIMESYQAVSDSDADLRYPLRLVERVSIKRVGESISISLPSKISNKAANSVMSQVLGLELEVAAGEYTTEIREFLTMEQLQKTRVSKNSLSWIATVRELLELEFHTQVELAQKVEGAEDSPVIMPQGF